MATDHWKNRVGRIKYAVADAAGPVNLDKEAEVKQCLSDWKRWANSGDKCPIYIHGKQLSTYASLPDFSKESHLFDFLQEHLFHKDTPDDVIQAAMSHFHQGGIFNATQMSLSRFAGEEWQHNHDIPRPGEAEQRIELTCDEKNNIRILEKNTYKKYTEGTTNHVCKGIKNDYYAKTQTAYVLTQQKNIELISFEVDCPKKKLKDLFEGDRVRKNVVNKILGYMHKLIGANASKDTVHSVEPTTIYTHK